MHIRMAWLTKKARCHQCGREMVRGEPIVRGYATLRNGFHVRRLWHPQCWLEQGMQYLAEHPLEPHHAGPGRPRMPLDEEQRKSRHALIQRRSRAVLKRQWLAEQFIGTEDVELRGELEHLLALEDIKITRITQEIEGE